MTRRVLFYVQHILGIGHLTRASRICRALCANGLDVCVVQGGMAVEGIDWGSARLQYLPAIRAGTGGYADLVDETGEPIGDVLRADRRDRLLALFDREQPDIVLIEAFPFGRRAMRFELLPLVERAHGRDPRPVVASSIRDILHENRKPGLNEKTVALLEAWFDLVLVHGDPEMIALEESFPLAGEIAAMVRHTGIVAPETGGALAGPSFDIVVSAGGGAVGHELLVTAAEVLGDTRFSDMSACIIAGPNMDDEVLGALRDAAPGPVEVVRFRNDFPALIAAARLSVSQCGYNTAADVLSAGCAAVFVPSAYQGETEQTRRAGLLAARGLGMVFAEAELAPDVLADAMARALEHGQAGRVPDLDGADHTARILAEAVVRDG